MTISHLIIAVFVGKYNKNWPDHRGPGWASVAFVSASPFPDAVCFRRRGSGRLMNTAAAVLHAEFWGYLGSGSMVHEVFLILRIKSVK